MEVFNLSVDAHGKYFLDKCTLYFYLSVIVFANFELLPTNKQGDESNY